MSQLRNSLSAVGQCQLVKFFANWFWYFKPTMLRYVTFAQAIGVDQPPIISVFWKIIKMSRDLLIATIWSRWLTKYSILWIMMMSQLRKWLNTENNNAFHMFLKTGLNIIRVEGSFSKPGIYKTWTIKNLKRILW